MRILWLIVTRGGNRNSKDLDEYLKILEILYLGIARATKSRVIVDSSKFPVRAALLRLIPSIDLYIVHLVRDPRAVAHSWMTSKLTTDFEKPAYLPKINPVSSAIWWNGWNLVSEYVGGFLPDKYMRLNYEIFVSDPHASINEILRLLGETRSELPLKDEKTVVLKKNHTIAGNPVRFLQGEIVIQPDLRWLTDMRPYHKSIVTLITLPFLSRFGYSDRGSAHSCSKTPAS